MTLKPFMPRKHKERHYQKNARWNIVPALRRQKDYARNTEVVSDVVWDLAQIVQKEVGIAFDTVVAVAKSKDASPVKEKEVFAISITELCLKMMVKTETKWQPKGRGP